MAASKRKSGLPILAFDSRPAWDAWLEAQPITSPGIWLKLAKAASGIASVSKQDAIDCALCHGWIDGQLQPFDARYWLVRFTPRRPKSKWSRINRERALELIKAGRMRAAGLRAVEAAKQDGRWERAYAPQSRAAVPDDLQLALNRDGEAKRYFDQLDSHNRYAIIYRVQDAKKPETRAHRIGKYVSMLSRGEVLYSKK
jgi:uncharacterized protein YdeI (YjbR/CyaY-like superfamily)